MPKVTNSLEERPNLTSNGCPLEACDEKKRLGIWSFNPKVFINKAYTCIWEWSVLEEDGELLMNMFHKIRCYILNMNKLHSSF